MMNGIIRKSIGRTRWKRQNKKARQSSGLVQNLFGFSGLRRAYFKLNVQCF
jgi:hypothetical protein